MFTSPTATSNSQVIDISSRRLEARAIGSVLCGKMFEGVWTTQQKSVMERYMEVRLAAKHDEDERRMSESAVEI
jgi:hypothetical protein